MTAICEVPEGFQCTIEALSDSFALYSLIGFSVFFVCVAAVIIAIAVTHR